MTNRLAQSSSPYLLQHADNPVDWNPWDDKALARSRVEDRPIFLSIGYAACHWCHVMAHESFEDEETAKILNENFVPIKVDREERPDLDSIYMNATVALTGSGGWPMSVFLTPDLKPFYAGTYFPPARRYNMPSFKEVLIHIANAYRTRREEINQAGDQLAGHLIKSQWAGSGSGVDDLSLTAAANNLIDQYDWSHGGWGSAPKFPQPMSIEFLFSRATRPDPNQDYLKAATHALRAMARGGMYDVIGGGFARYSVDAFWRVPHFEKMLYDNAQLARAYLHGYMLAKEKFFREVCESTLDFLLREMTDPSGGFYSSLDADSEGEEGKFYTWSFDDIKEILCADFELFKSAYGLTPSGNWEGKIVLQRALDDASLAAHFQLGIDETRERLTHCQALLLQARAHRARPSTDDKVLTSWNALALIAFAEAARYLHRADYLEAARRNAHFLLEALHPHDRLLRSWRNGQSRHNAYLEDYAGLIIALLALYQTDPDPRWYQHALKLGDEMLNHFRDPNNGFFDTRSDHENLLLRPKDLQDNATPSGNALAATALLQLAAYGDRPNLRAIAEEMIGRILPAAIKYPAAFAQWLIAADFAVGPVQEVALLEEPDQSCGIPLRLELTMHYNPRRITAIAIYPPPEGSPALLHDRPLIGGGTTAYVCQNFVCKQPVARPEDFSDQLRDAH
jgi:hypothetical protein